MINVGCGSCRGEEARRGEAEGRKAETIPKNSCPTSLEVLPQPQYSAPRCTCFCSLSFVLFTLFPSLQDLAELRALSARFCCGCQHFRFGQPEGPKESRRGPDRKKQKFPGFSASSAAAHILYVTATPRSQLGLAAPPGAGVRSSLALQCFIVFGWRAGLSPSVALFTLPLYWHLVFLSLNIDLFVGLIPSCFSWINQSMNGYRFATLAVLLSSLKD
jgi:hypothetical protein